VSKTKKPTTGELAILRVLWARGSSTVREVAVAMGRDAAYTTVLKLMQIMTEKGLITRDAAARAHVYSAASSEDHTQRQLVADLLDRVFDGSASRLLMQALAARQASPEELRAIRRLIASAQSTRESKKKGES
jgi:BlaI family transcriptional regulator, penicillinase repressor